MTMAALSLTAGSAIAQTTQAKSPVRSEIAVTPDFTCPGASMCLFTGDNFNDNVTVLATSSNRGRWEAGEVNGQLARSANDNSNSIFFYYIYGNEFCAAPGKYIFPNAAWKFYIEYGVTSCAGAYVPPPP
jgi:hypothetical protein